MANYTGSHVPKLSHLRQLAVQVQSAIGEVAQAAADAVTAVAAAKADKVEVVSLSIPASGWSTDSTAAALSRRAAGQRANGNAATNQAA